MTEATHSPLNTVWQTLKTRIAPVWPLEDYVAVNPFMGLSHLSFFEAQQLLMKIAHQDILMPWSHYQQAYARGEFTREDLQAVLEHSPYAISEEAVLHALDTGTDTPEKTKYYRLSEWIDAQHGTYWEMLVQDEITRYCAAHYDEGFAAWASPWQHLSLYQAWKIQAHHDKRLEKLGFHGLNAYLSRLPEEPFEALENVLQQMQVPPEEWEDMLYAYLLSMNGWAAWIQYRQRINTSSDKALMGLLAMRLIYEWALWKHSPYPHWQAFQADVAQTVPPASDHGTNAKARYLCQQALEQAYQRQLWQHWRTSVTPSTGQSPLTSFSAQVFFCIDVRSERIRRHIEHEAPSVAALGCAGFFGMPMALRAPGDLDFVKQCPAPATPAYTLEAQNTSAWPYRLRLFSKIWKQFKSSAVSSFGFIEIFGLGYLVPLLANTFRKYALPPTITSPDLSELDLNTQIDLAESLLKQLSLTQGLSPLVLLCGHGSTVQNTPHQAAYDCGACCGHSGAPNALMAVNILNRTDVREGLRGRGIEVPHGTHFLAGLHDTTRDETHVLRGQYPVPESHQDALQALLKTLHTACTQTREERARVLGTTPAHLLKRSVDWSEQRPEWGLAGNAAFLIGSRPWTTGLNLAGRSFLHHYEATQDPTGEVLTGILTAPVVVATWINLQYYASSVTPELYSSGDKALHHVLGNMGVIEGNSGDLRTGLPYQSVHNGKSLMYAPLRLSVVVEAPRERIATILAQQPALQESLNNAWFFLFAWDQGEVYRYHRSGWLLEKRYATS